MKGIKYAVMAFVFSASLACSNPKNDEVDAIYQELVQGHDEVMPKSMMIPDIREKMMEVSKKGTEEQQKQALELSTSLLKAEDAMNEWMIEFGDAINGEDDKKLELYKKLKPEIEQLKADTEEAIAKAKALTAELEAL